MDLAKWRQLAGALGKLVVTSRTRLAENELLADGRFYRIQLGEFSFAQSCQFLVSAAPPGRVWAESGRLSGKQ